MKICFILLIVGIHSAALAGDAPANGGSLIPDTRRVWTVKADRSSGRIVRSVVVQPKLVRSIPVKAVEEKELKGAGKLSSDANLNALVDDAAARHRVDPLLVHSVIQVESGYNKYAVSPKGAQGLMQLIPATARRYGVKNPFDPKENIEAGVKYLRDLQSMFGDDRLALAAYNAGEGAVTRYGWIPPYSETQNYVYQVGLRYGAARRAASATAVATPPPPKKVEEYVDAEGRVHLLLR